MHNSVAALLSIQSRISIQVYDNLRCGFSKIIVKCFMIIGVFRGQREKQADAHHFWWFNKGKIGWILIFCKNICSCLKENWRRENICICENFSYIYKILIFSTSSSFRTRSKKLQQKVI